jgi:hypothetical protein
MEQEKNETCLEHARRLGPALMKPEKHRCDSETNRNAGQTDKHKVEIVAAALRRGFMSSSPLRAHL